MTINLRFTDKDWERIAHDWTAWWQGELDRPMVIIEDLEPPAGVTLPEALHFTTDLPLDTPAEEILDRYQAHLEITRFYGDAWPRWYPNYGPGIVAGFLGAKVCPVPGTVWFEPAGQLSFEELHLTYDSDNVWWRRVRDITSLAVERWGDQVTICHTDLGGNLDILASLRTTQQLLLDLYDAPDEIERLVSEITCLWLRYYDEFYAIIQQADRGTTNWGHLWSPGRTYMLQSDFAYMISPEMFERFVMPDLQACCQALDHAFYHLDGKGQIPHLDMLLSLERLRGIQWIPGDGMPPPEAWLSLLKRILDGGKLCQLFVTAQGARTIVQELGGRGFAFSIAERMSGDDAEDFLRLLAVEDVNAG
jgi:5-methyltetrahydrofolate--homocysteine methyltransferase